MIEQFTLKFFSLIIFLFLLLVLLQNYSSSSIYLFQILLHIEFPEIIDNFIVSKSINHVEEYFLVDFGLLKKKLHLF
jgi:hypothetical protein